jgi:GAF domain-containing protein
MLQASQTGQSIQDNDAEKPTLTIPLQVRDQVVGVLSFTKGKGAARWTAEETTVLETLADQLGQALDSARLHQDTQRRAQREQLQRQIIEKVRAAPDIDTIARTAAKELAKVMDGARGFVKLSTKSVDDE